jgi:hypothetical protein
MSCEQCAGIAGLPSFGGCGNCDAKARMQKERPAKNKTKNQRASLRKYGLDEDRYASMLAAQKGVCKICENPETAKNPDGTTQRLSVDHCHRFMCRHVRGLLCHSCNKAIGLLGDDPDRIARAVEYLRPHHRTAHTPEAQSALPDQLGTQLET